MNPIISIIIPIYNVEKFLPRCIESLINQTYKEIEIILVNGGSPDRCDVICNGYANKDKRIKVIHQKNQGVSAARNAGIEIAQGEFIGFVDPDDFVDNKMYETLLNALIDTKSDIAIGGYNYYDEKFNLDHDREYPIKDNEILDRKDIYRKLSDLPPTIRHGVVQKLFKRELIGDLRFNTKLKSCEDLEFLLQYLRNVTKAVFVHKPLYNNLVRSGSATHGALKIQSLKESFKIHHRMYQDTIDEFPELQSYAVAFIMDVCLLKYNESKQKFQSLNNEIEKQEGEDHIQQMRKFIRKMAIHALSSKDIYWKTKIAYLLLWIRR